MDTYVLLIFKSCLGRTHCKFALERIVETTPMHRAAFPLTQNRHFNLSTLYARVCWPSCTETLAYSAFLQQSGTKSWNSSMFSVLFHTAAWKSSRPIASCDWNMENLTCWESFFAFCLESDQRPLQASVPHLSHVDSEGVFAMDVCKQTKAGHVAWDVRS